MGNAQCNIVIVGGGSAGWLTAGILAAEYLHTPGIHITLIESSDISSIGVGEGTWPSMRTTLQRIGISETDLIRCCNASFKQGSLFRQWRNNDAQDLYHHPFSPPVAAAEFDIYPHWQPYQQQIDFAHAVSPQPRLIEAGLAPKQISTPEYAFVCNYGYHLDAGKFVELLRRHCTDKLAVRHIIDNVIAVHGQPDAPIRAVQTEQHGEISGELFIDCSGFAALLIEQHFKIGLHQQNKVLFNDTALAVQVPYTDPQQPIASATLSSARQAGWIWDIGLQNRRGVGYVYSSAHTSDEAAQQTLSKYIGEQGQDLSFRKIPIRSGYRQKLWHHNCVAIGLSAGFVEPLEASALVLIELSARFVAEQLPLKGTDLSLVRDRFNSTFAYRWQQIVDFLKLHYVLSSRDDSDYWQDNRQPDSIPDSLQHLLTFWQHNMPSRYDFPHAEEMFPSASFQYIYYGMGKHSQLTARQSIQRYQQRAQEEFRQTAQKARQLVSQLPGNRALIEKIQAHGLQTL
ncbi:tryptophan halogenase family protein [Bowmanella denitrificans]|uniref:tryptophan halogenase family protein n=1 Tax=Bowmanella denitrificans TaxID=366582 RepID=UPI000C9A251A|nr:tryptophan halogenase family protein [Bowmanella denitrificans]